MWMRDYNHTTVACVCVCVCSSYAVYFISPRIFNHKCCLAKRITRCYGAAVDAALCRLKDKTTLISAAAEQSKFLSFLITCSLTKVLNSI